jgi:hypothetical protein
MNDRIFIATNYTVEFKVGIDGGGVVHLANRSAE